MICVVCKRWIKLGEGEISYMNRVPLKKEIEDAIRRIEDDFPDIERPETFESARYVSGRYYALKWVLAKL